MRFFALLIALVLAAPFAAAQGQNNYGSIYSRYGVGERIDAGSSQADMLGGAGTALRSGYTMLNNPALWSDETVTSFSTGVGVTGVKASDALNTDASRTTSGDISSMHLAVPLLPGRLGATIAYRPYSRVNYRSAVTGSLFGESDSTDYTLNQEGSGGLQRFSAGLGGRIGSVLQVGASADFIFGSFEYLQRTEFDNPAYLETRQALSTRMSGVSGTVGAAVTARALRSDEDALTFAGSFTLPTSLSGTRTLTLGESLDRDTLAASVDGSMTLPLIARGGIAYRSGKNWLVAADAVYEPWAAFESTLAVGGFDTAVGVDQLRDRLRVGGGFEIVPAGRDRNASLLSRSSYRIGAYRENGLYAPTGSAVSTTAITGGVSLPNRISGARVDFGFEVGTRGSTDGLLVKDLFLSGTATFNFGERWFVRRRLN